MSKVLLGSVVGGSLGLIAASQGTTIAVFATMKGLLTGAPAGL